MIEEDYPRRTRDELDRVGRRTSATRYGLEGRNRVAQDWATDAQQQLRNAHPRDAATLQQYRQIVTPATRRDRGTSLAGSGSDRIRSTRQDATRWISGGLPVCCDIVRPIRIPAGPSSTRSCRSRFWCPRAGRRDRWRSGSIPKARTDCSMALGLVVEVRRLLKARCRGDRRRL